MEKEEVIEEIEKEEKPTPGANQELEEARKKIKELEEKAQALDSEKKGIYKDLKEERDRRRQFEQSLSEKEKKIQEEEDSDPFDGLGDDDFITGKQLKQLGKHISEREKKRIIAEVRMRGDERVANDEARMQEICEMGSEKFPIPYDEAIEAFIELAQKDPTLWQQFDAAKYRPGGRPSELAYKIALREHPKFKDLDKKKAREELLDEFEDKGQKPKKLRPGGGGSKRIEDMTDEEISNMSDDELDKLARSH